MLNNVRINDIVNITMVCGIIALGTYYRISGNYDAGVLGSTLALIELIKLTIMG